MMYKIRYCDYDVERDHRYYKVVAFGNELLGSFHTSAMTDDEFYRFTSWLDEVNKLIDKENKPNV